MRQGSQQVRKWCQESKIIPVLTIHKLEHAVPVAKALAEGGIKVVEVTLRTKVALEAIATIREKLPDLIVAAGTVRTPEDIYKAKQHNTHFIISPGTTIQLLEAAYDAIIPIAPGITNASEIMQWNNYNIDFFKFFPAEYIGGTDTLKAFHSPLPDIAFCPTGGINTENARKYLDMPNVLCVGGSWIVTKEMCDNKDWSTITKLASEARAL